MQIRCVKCKSVFGAPMPRILAGDPVVCTRCGSRHSPKGGRSAFEDPQQHEENARLFAAASTITLPDANSVLLGFMTLPQAQELNPRSRRRARAAPAARSKPVPAAAAGRPGTASATTRGRSRTPPVPAPVMLVIEAPTESEPRSARFSLFLVLVLLLVSTAIGSYGWNSWQRQAEETRRVARDHRNASATPAVQIKEELGGPAAVRTTAKVRRDLAGKVVAIGAISPLDVLTEFCATYDPPGTCQPLEVVSLKPARVGVRIGVFRDLSHVGRTYAVRIRRDRTTRKWIIANHGKSIVPFALDPAQLEGERVEVRPAASR